MRRIPNAEIAHRLLTCQVKLWVGVSPVPSMICTELHRSSIEIAGTQPNWPVWAQGWAF
jgi:hypothetical protein